jgi:hypothetical protein
MRFDDLTYGSNDPLLRAVISVFRRGIEMITMIDDRFYTRAANGTGSVGGHFRHNLDFVNSFLNGIATRQIDYNLRERDALVETGRNHAIGKIEFAIERLAQLTDEIFERLVYVRSEVDGSRWLSSSVLRELEFLHSHTVHHHALIKEKLVSFGVKTETDFGVAPSTLEHRKRRAA